MLASQSVVTVTHLDIDPHPTPTSAVVGEQNEIWNVSAKNTFIMETFLAKTFQIPFCSSLWAGWDKQVKRPFKFIQLIVVNTKD